MDDDMRDAQRTASPPVEHDDRKEAVSPHGEHADAPTAAAAAAAAALQAQSQPNGANSDEGPQGPTRGYFSTDERPTIAATTALPQQPRSRPSMGIASLLNSGPAPSPSKRQAEAGTSTPDDLAPARTSTSPVPAPEATEAATATNDVVDDATDDQPPPPESTEPRAKEPSASAEPSTEQPAQPTEQPTEQAAADPEGFTEPAGEPNTAEAEPKPKPKGKGKAKAAPKPRLRLSRKPRTSAARAAASQPIAQGHSDGSVPSVLRPAPAQSEGASPSPAPAPAPAPAAAPKRSKRRQTEEGTPDPEPKTRKRQRTEQVEPDLEAPENVSIWAPALEQYRSEAYLRRDAVEAAYGHLEDKADEAMVRQLTKAYLTRYEAVHIQAERKRQAARVAEEQKRAADQRRRERRRMQAAQEKADRAARAAEARQEQTERLIEQEIWETLHPPPTSDVPQYLPSGIDGRAESGSEDDEAPLVSRVLGTDSPHPQTKGKNRGDDSMADATSHALPTPEEEVPTYDEDGYQTISSARAAALEAAHRKVWTGLAKRDIPKLSRVVQSGQSNHQGYWRRISTVVQREAKRAVGKQAKTVKDIQMRGRRAMREMLLFWRKNEKEERELRKAAEKAAADKARQDEELREAQRQARKLNFLITQTELYSHFVGSKLNTDQTEQSADTESASTSALPPAPSSAPNAPTDLSAEELEAIDFDNEDETNLRAHAARNAQAAVEAAKQKAQAFDDQAALDRAAAEAAAAAGSSQDASNQLDEMNFMHPEGMGEVTVGQPKMLTCELKEYQLKGLNWLASLYEQGINGILADEMGLGKTVQSISLMAYLAEVHDIWGPFLVISPSSTLHNWQQEISKFVPDLKVLPYWGSVKDRQVLRKFFNKKHTVYTRDAPFHVLVTSYQLAVSDEKYLNRVKWQYMVLDEAQAIKSSSSARWKTLLGFNCRNRLLLTGTPVQNSMQELWALLHFIMPSLFDNHDEFSEWFSRDIEANAENKGALNEHQLRRLHMILKPFMLRRVKKNVQNQLGEKVEVDLLCDMSSRQRHMYNALKERVSITELVRAGAAESDQGLKSLMNLVMQFRKVCNHPELFERADVKTPLAWASVPRPAQSLAREGDTLDLSFSARNPISFALPRLVTNALPHVPGWDNTTGFDTQYLSGLMNIWRQPNLVDSPSLTDSLVTVAGWNEVDAEAAFHAPRISSWLATQALEQQWDKHGMLLTDSDFAASTAPRPLARVKPTLPYAGDEAWSNPLLQEEGLPPLDQIRISAATLHPFASPHRRVIVPAAQAPPVEVVASDAHLNLSLPSLDPTGPNGSNARALYGLPPSTQNDPVALAQVRGERGDTVFPPQAAHHGGVALQGKLPLLPPDGLYGATPRHSLPGSSVQMPSIERLIHDSSKLARLDSLLRELKAGGHRVLIYFQMTRMIDLMEEYLVSRQYKYLRLDGASKISDRRDMVTDWQTRPDLFIFLLSTRAGGLGITLTAADTVILYESDWNPSNDSQAMDRAHRLGQTKQVTVYRLITRGTIDERIVRLARSKKAVQDMVVGTQPSQAAQQAQSDAPGGQDIVNLLLDDDEMAQDMLRRKQDAPSAPPTTGPSTPTETSNSNSHRDSIRAKKRALKAAASITPAPMPTTWALDDDEDDFFGAKPPPPQAPAETPAEPSKRRAKKAPASGASGTVAKGEAPAKPRASAASSAAGAKKRAPAKGKSEPTTPVSASSPAPTEPEP